MVSPHKDANLLLHEPSQWDASTAWYPGDVEAALGTADGGYLEGAADIFDAMLRDDRIFGVVKTRVGALLGLNNSEKLSFETSQARVEKAIKVDLWDSCQEPELGKLIKWGLFLGVGYGRALPVKQAGRWVRKLRAWHPRFLSFAHQSQKWQVWTRENGTVTIEPDDETWTFFLPYGQTRPWAEGCWLAAGLLWLVKLHALRGWGKHNEQHGSGAKVGKAPQGAKEADRRKFWSDLKIMARSASIVLPYGYELEQLEATARTWETFADAERSANAGLSIVVLGQPLTTEVPNAANTGATAASKVRQDYLEFDAGQVSTWAHEYLGPWANWNFSAYDQAPWLVFDTAPPEDRAKEASTINTLGDGIAKLLGVEPGVDVRALLERFGIPLRADAPAPAPIESPALDDDAAKPGPADNPAANPAETLQMSGPTGPHRCLAGGTAGPDDGFANGQGYVDRLVEINTPVAAKWLAPDVEAILAILDGIEDKDGWQEMVKARLLDAYVDMSPDGLAETLEKALILAELAGRAAVLEDL